MIQSPISFTKVGFNILRYTLRNRYCALRMRFKDLSADQEPAAVQLACITSHFKVSIPQLRIANRNLRAVIFLPHCPYIKAIYVNIGNGVIIFLRVFFIL